MPDFDTHRPQEPDRPSKLHMFVAASRQHISAGVRLIDGIMVRYRWGLLYSILSLVILATVLLVWRDFGNPSEEAANQSPQEPPEYTAPGYQNDEVDNQSPQEIPEYYAEYQNDEADCYLEADGESGTAEMGTCYDVYMKPTDAKLLARVTRKLVFRGQYARAGVVVRVYFYDFGESSYPYATAFYFGAKQPPCVTLGRELLDSATVFWHEVYVFGDLQGGEGEGTTCDLPEQLTNLGPQRRGL